MKGRNKKAGARQKRTKSTQIKNHTKKTFKRDPRLFFGVLHFGRLHVWCLLWPDTFPCYTPTIQLYVSLLAMIVRKLPAFMWLMLFLVRLPFLCDFHRLLQFLFHFLCQVNFHAHLITTTQKLTPNCARQIIAENLWTCLCLCVRVCVFCCFFC